MGRSQGSLVRRVLVGVCIGFMAAAFAAPAAAFAANTASFSSASPMSGSYSMANTPKLSVTVYDKYGISGSGAYAMTLDGEKVAASYLYIVTGKFNPKKPDYRRMRLTFQVPSALSVGTHTVSVRIKDKKKKVSTYSWKFHVDDASDPATFSALSPASGSSSQLASPKVSATVVSRWDVRGTSSFSMTIDGVAVADSISYTKSGDYRSSKISFQSFALSVGSHQVVVTVKDASGRTTSKAWSFTVLPPDPVYTEMPAESTSCASCHAGYPVSHPMSACTSCHGSGRPVPGRIYTSRDTSAHTLSCALDCHGDPWTGPFPHMLSSDCASCHTNPQFPTLPQTHGTDAASIKSLHASTPTFCTAKFCHASSLTAEHYRSEPGRQQRSCATCHGSTAPLVVAAISQGSTACTSCHAFGSFVHPDTSVAHAAAGSCVSAECHATDVAEIHDGNCSACHSPDTIATKTCITCHGTTAPVGPYHTRAASSHALDLAGDTGCVAFGCHGASEGMDAAETHEGSCSACHDSGDEPNLDCAGCHDEPLYITHIRFAPDHASPASSCTVAGCHSANVAVTHYKNGAARCVACHAQDKIASVACANCHEADEVAVHEDAAVAHDITGNTCLGTGCHTDTDVASLHRAGGIGCVVCHGPSKTPTLDCEALCHAGGQDVIHDDAGSRHIASVSPTCVSAVCHTIDVTDAVPNHDKCTSCHWRGTPLYTDCIDCHETPLTSMHPKATPKHVVPESMCETTCHSTDVALIHAAQTGCVACHNTSKDPSTTCADCHAGSPAALHPQAAGDHNSATPGCVLAGCHSSDVTVVHVKAGDVRCVACHASDVEPTTDCTDADCHVSGVATKHAARIESDHDAPAGGCVKDGCHGTTDAGVNVAALHKDALGCVDCHDGVKTPSVTCSNCHSTDMAVVHEPGDAKHLAPVSSCDKGLDGVCHYRDVARVHTGADDNCATCHAPGKDKAQICAACHSGEFWGGVHNLTRPDQHTPTAGACVTSACHTVSASDLHSSQPPTHGPGCTPCHRTGPLSLDCQGCHEAADVATDHPAADIDHAFTDQVCANAHCHGASDSGANVALLHANLPASCSVCHADDKDPSLACADCHEGATALDYHDHLPALHMAAGGGTCVRDDCHGSTQDGIDVMSLHQRRTGSIGCPACHGIGRAPSVDCGDSTACHDIDPATEHAKFIVTDGVDKHAVAAGSTCGQTACHAGATVTALHGTDTCWRCHSGGATPPADCASVICHQSGDLEIIHAPGATSHVAIDATCVSPTCHVTAVDVTHAGQGGPNCTACHAAGGGHALTAVCSNCHVNASKPGQAPSPESSPAHPTETAADSVHTVDVAGCSRAGNCHSTNVAYIHATATENHQTPRRCRACHGAGQTPSTECSDCHTGGFAPPHPAPMPEHATPASTPAMSCTKSDCHDDASVALIHVKDGVAKCLACHNDTYPLPADMTCTQAAPCHGNTAFPPTHPAPETAHLTSGEECTQMCHQTAIGKSDVAKLHVGSDEAKHCVHCHNGVDAPIKTCQSCHGDGKVAGPFHLDAAVRHMTTVPAACTTGSCHQTLLNVTDASVIHVKGGQDRCIACHAATVNPALLGTTCTNCHAGGVGHPHPTCDGCHTGAGHWIGNQYGDPGGYPQPLAGRQCASCHGETFQPLDWGATWNHGYSCNAHCHTEYSCDCHEY